MPIPSCPIIAYTPSNDKELAMDGDGGDCRQETWQHRDVFTGNLLRPHFTRLNPRFSSDLVAGALGRENGHHQVEIFAPPS
jgi:hypothetical protein